MKNWVDTIRYWLIKRLAGGRLIVLNANIRGGVSLGPFKPGIVSGCTFDGTDTLAWQMGEDAVAQTRLRLLSDVG